MAEYIDDSGIYNKDALFVGVEDVAWSKNATDRAIWFSSTGTATTGFTLPDSEWIVYEVYGMTGTSLTADYTTLTGSTQLHGKKEFTTTIGTILTTLNAWRTALDKTNYTTYDIIATHYKGSDLADVYEADETTAFATATTTDGSYTGHSSEWIIADALLADSVSVNTFIGLTSNVSTFTEVVAGYSYDIDFTGTSDTKLYFELDFTETTSIDLVLKFNYALTSGVIRFDSYYDGTGYVSLPDGEHIFTEGANSINLGSRANLDTAMIRSAATLTGVGRISNIIVEKV